ncbi:MAG: YbbR-like domain-containing protein [candidate division Zixibacteria bacterium]|nr:YbbR-like domain-containing protein [candidate division Zixibacteria bacterium]
MPKIFENLWVKLAALILAFLLWFHVATNKIYQEEATLPLSQVVVPGKLILSEPPPDSVTVLVAATGKKLMQSNWKKVGLKLILGNNRTGRFKVEISPDNLSLAKTEKVEMLEVISPREIEVDLDRKTEKRVMVRSQVTVVPADGFGIRGADSISPAMVTITGPYTLLAGVNEIQTEQVAFEKARKNVSTRIPLKHPGVYGMVIQPDTVDIFVQVVPVKTRNFADIPLKLGNSPIGGRYDLFPPMIEVRAAGTAAAIDSLKSNHIMALVDYRKADNSGLAPVQVHLPDGISLVHLSVDSVRIIKR